MAAAAAATTTTRTDRSPNVNVTRKEKKSHSNLDPTDRFFSSPYLPELGTDLVTALSGLDVDDFTHLGLFF